MTQHLTRRAALLAGAGLIAAPTVLRAQARAVNVGVILPLSGANAQFGVNSRNGIELVADEIDAAGGIAALGGAKVNLVVADSTSTPTTAGTVAQRLIAQNSVAAILGAFASSLTLAVSEVAERRGIPLLTMSFSDQVTGRGFQNIFQVVSKASTLGRAQFDGTLALARAAGETIERAAILYEDTAYGTSQAQGLRDAAKAAGVAVPLDEGYPLGITDATPLVAKLRASGAQVVFPVSYLNDSLLIIRSMRQQGLDLPAIGGAAGYVIPDFQRGLGQFAEGVLSIAPANYDQAPEYTERFRKRFGYFMVHEALEHAVLMDNLARAMEAAKSAAPAAIREALRATSFTEGWSQAMGAAGVKYDDTGLVTVWPEALAKAPAAWRSRAK